MLFSDMFAVFSKKAEMTAHLKIAKFFIYFQNSAIFSFDVLLYYILFKKAFLYSYIIKHKNRYDGPVVERLPYDR